MKIGKHEKDNRGKTRRSRIRVTALVLAVTLLASSIAFAGKTSSETQAEIDANKNQLENVQKQQSDANKKLKDGKTKVSQLTAEIGALDKKIYTAQVEINNLNKDINETKAEIQDAIGRLEAKQDEVTTQNDNLNQRLRTMYKNGNAGMLSVLLGSSSMSDLLTNMDMVERIYDADADLLGALQGQYDAIDEEKQNLQNLKDKLINQQENVKAKKTALQNDQDSAESKRGEVEKSNEELARQIDELNKEANALTAEILRLQSSGDYVGGGMSWPAPASHRITSPFGNRIHPILKVLKMHTGIDIGAAKGTNIVAANGGTVIKAGWNNSYGYMVMIDHGGGIVTLYAHSSKLLVSSGDVVSKGQVIALVGSTGQSTGPHLHFEVRINGVYKNPLDYVSP